jgi:hypothetical protein
MKRIPPTVVWGSLLIIGGIVFLLQSLGVFDFAGSLAGYIIGGVFVLAGIGFLTVFFGDPKQWWPVIPGLILAAVGALIILGATAPVVAEVVGGPLIVGSISLSFWVIYLVDRRNWWAVIPAGVLLSVALAILAGTLGETSGRDAGMLIPGVIFIGIGVTFGLLWLLPMAEGRQKWPIYVAVPTILLGVLFLLGFAALGAYIVPVVLILGGGLLLYRAFVRR